MFLGGELARPARTIRRGLTAAWLVTAVLVIAAVAPLAAAPAFTRAPIPGMAVAARFAGHGFAVAVGLGVAVSVAGVMLAEYFALSRLISTITSWRLRPVIIALGAALVLSAPVTLIDPDRIYSFLIKPSLVALWLSQLIVFAVYPRFAARQHDRRLPDLGADRGRHRVRPLRPLGHPPALRDLTRERPAGTPHQPEALLIRRQSDEFQSHEHHAPGAATPAAGTVSRAGPAGCWPGGQPG